ncbi:hypothetical protein P7C73_g4340, partial [Tremellales sp. Uapishka_1]
MPIPTKDEAMQYDASSPQVMTAFYRRLFPYKPFFLWLNQDYVPTKLFTHREFAFTLAGDVYFRHRSFHSIDDFKKELIRLTPSRFEIGPQYSARPRDKKTLAAGAFVPQRRELVFDIDMTDYDEIRTCCSDKRICKRCWGYIAAAVKVLDHTLRETFGFRHLLWVYSGRRGIHCWISDQAALDLNDNQRKAMVTFLDVVKGGKDSAKKVNVRGDKKDRELYPAVKDALDQLKPDFVKLCLRDQDCFLSETGWEALLALLPDERDQWQANPDRQSEDKWGDLVSTVARLKGNNQALFVRQYLGRLGLITSFQRKFERAMEDIILQYTYPRIDAAVSQLRNHLLKSPFCVHPATGRVCVPINASLVDEFDPETVPTVGDLLVQLDRVPAQNGDESIKGRKQEGELAIAD